MQAFELYIGSVDAAYGRADKDIIKTKENTYKKVVVPTARYSLFLP